MTIKRFRILWAQVLPRSTKEVFFYIVHNAILFLLLFISLFCYPLEILAVFGQRDILSEILAQRDRMRQL